MNTQPTERRFSTVAGLLEVHSLFYTIQGEGPFAGRPAVFVRLAGCNLKCPLCDTDYTSNRICYWPSNLIGRVKATNKAATLVVITGGEPFRQNLVPFVEMLLHNGFTVQIETNGTIYDPFFPYAETTVVCSPKTGKLALGYEADPAAIKAFKYVAQAGKMGSDGLPLLALGHSATPQVARPPEAFNGEVFLQPADEQGGRILVGHSIANGNNLEACIASCKQHGYTLGIQIHKLIGEQ